MFYDKEKCAEIFTDEEHQENVIIKALFWFAFFIFVSSFYYKNSTPMMTRFLIGVVLVCFENLCEEPKEHIHIFKLVLTTKFN